MSELNLLQGYLFVSGLLVAIGLVGFLARRNMIVMFLAAELVLQGVALSFVAWSRFRNDFGGQALVIFIIAVAACEAAIALALVLMLSARTGKLDVALWQNLREANQPPYVDEELPERIEEKPHWPRLTPAGIEPPEQEDAPAFRTHV